MGSFHDFSMKKSNQLNHTVSPEPPLFTYMFMSIDLEVEEDLPLDFFYTGIQFYLQLNPYLCFISLLYLDLYVLGDDALLC